MYEFSGVTFHPWIGKHYGRSSRFGFRLLVLGESHYDEELEYTDCDFTRYVVRTWGQENRHKFLTIIANVLRGVEGWIDDETRREIWKHVGFYNFVQSVVSGPKVAPVFRQWCDAQGPFETVVQCLKPDAILVLGWRVSEHVLYRPDGVVFDVVTHPSSGHFRYAQAIPTFQELARKRKEHIASA